MEEEEGRKERMKGIMKIRLKQVREEGKEPLNF